MAYLSTWMEGLTPELEKKAFEELGETPEVKAQAVKDLRRLINEQADFRPRINDAFLLRFLRARKYEVPKAYKTLRNFYIFKARYSRILTDFLPSEVAPILDMNNFVVLPKRHPSGAAVGILRLGYYDSDKMSPEQLIAALMVCSEVVIEPEATQIAGYIVIFDLAKLGFRLLKHYCKPALLFRCIRATQESLPYRVKALHIVNEPLSFNIFLTLAKTLLSEKLSKRVIPHGSNLKSLHQYIPADILPTEYGGKAGLMNCKEFNNNISSREAQFEKLNKFGFQEKSISIIRKQDSRSIFSF